MAVVQLLIMVTILVTGLLFLNMLSKTIRNISFVNRKIDPLSVWFLLIPVYNYFYFFIVVSRLSQSIQIELQSRNLQVTRKPTYTIGILAATFFSLNAILGIFKLAGIHNDIINIPLTLTGFTIWIVYWVQVAQYKKVLDTLRPAIEESTI